MKIIKELTFFQSIRVKKNLAIRQMSKHLTLIPHQCKLVGFNYPQGQDSVEI